MSRRHWCLAAVLIGSASATLMQNFITVSLPTIASELAGHSTVGWVVGAYMLASTAVLLNSGRWADRQGPRKVYVVGTLLYAAATVLTSQSQSMVQLIMFRVIQGLGAGIIVPASMAAVTRYWRDKRLGRIIGLLGSMQVVATLIGAPLGGWLTSVLGWRVAFASPALLSIVALAFSLSLPGSRLPSEPAEARSFRSVLAEPVLVRGLISTAGLSSLRCRRLSAHVNGPYAEDGCRNFRVAGTASGGGKRHRLRNRRTARASCTHRGNRVADGDYRRPDVPGASYLVADCGRRTRGNWRRHRYARDLREAPGCDRRRKRGRDKRVCSIRQERRWCFGGSPLRSRVDAARGSFYLSVADLLVHVCRRDWWTYPVLGGNHWCFFL